MKVKYAANLLKSKLKNEEITGYYELDDNKIVFVAKLKNIPSNVALVLTNTTHYLVTDKGDIIPTNPLRTNLKGKILHSFH